MGQDYLRALHVFERLNGVKHLVRGNHDGSMVERLPWDSVTDQAFRRHERRRMTLCHYRWTDWPGRGHGGVMLYGHRHGQVPAERDRLDVDVDCWGLAPGARGPRVRAPGGIAGSVNSSRTSRTRGPTLTRAR